MKFDVWKDIMSRSSYFKSRSDLVTVTRVAGGPKMVPPQFDSFSQFFFLKQ